ncbi:hypothetical protein ACUJ8N_28680 [Streptomyces sp. ESR1.13]|uniref:hypothetical protein n=1 Tax=unclassified Streptomyces TaxID=2593676 RepID=UPI004041324C
MSAFLQQLPARALLERQRTGREGCCTAVREDPALPPGHGARRPQPPVSDTP